VATKGRNPSIEVHELRMYTLLSKDIEWQCLAKTIRK